MHCIVGQPVDVGAVLARGRQEGWDDKRLHAAVADHIGGAIADLKAELEEALNLNTSTK